jgi:hypothetical protein
VSYNAIEGIFVRRLVGAAVRSYKLGTGRYSFAFIQDDRVVEQGRCHLLIGEDGVSLLDPRSDDVTVVPLENIVSVELPKTTFRRPVLSVMLAKGNILELSDTMKGSQADRLTDSLRSVVPGARPLPGLRFFAGYVQSARGRREMKEVRTEAGKRGELLAGDALAALREPVEAEGWCVYLGSAVPPERPEGPGFIGFALAGASRFGLVNPHLSTTDCWQSASYEDVTTVAYREEHSGSSPDTYLFEVVSNRGHQPYLKRDGDYVQHIAFRVHAPAADDDPNVAEVLLQRASNQSKFDVRIGPEEDIDGLVLLPITPHGPDESAS